MTVYKINNEFGEEVARAYTPIDVAHIYNLYGPGHEIIGPYRKLLYPTDSDSPVYDPPSSIAARVIDRGLNKTRRGRVVRDSRKVVIGKQRWQVGPNWQQQKQAKWLNEHVRMGEQRTPAPSPQS